MRFVLTGRIIDGIIYHMENRDGEFVFDTKSGISVPRKKGPMNGPPPGIGEDGAAVPHDGPRFVPLPSWSSMDGYRLMESFAATILHEELRGKLRAALENGKGVFRSFKTVLAEYPDALRLWHYFKARALRGRVLEWYNDLRESWGLERLAGEPEDNRELTRMDFHVRPAREEDAEPARELHLLCREAKTPAPEGEIPETGAAPATRAARPRGGLRETGAFRPLVVAETADGDFAGYGGAAEDGENLRVAVEVREDYRGMGVGSVLLEQTLAALPPASSLALELPLEYEGFGQVLIRHGFTPAILIYTQTLPAGRSGPPA